MVGVQPTVKYVSIHSSYTRELFNLPHPIPMMWSRIDFAVYENYIKEDSLLFDTFQVIDDLLAPDLLILVPRYGLCKSKAKIPIAVTKGSTYSVVWRVPSHLFPLFHVGVGVGRQHKGRMGEKNNQTVVIAAKGMQTNCNSATWLAAPTTPTVILNCLAL